MCQMSTNSHPRCRLRFTVNVRIVNWKFDTIFLENQIFCKRKSNFPNFKTYKFCRGYWNFLSKLVFPLNNYRPPNHAGTYLPYKNIAAISNLFTNLKDELLHICGSTILIIRNIFRLNLFTPLWVRAKHDGLGSILSLRYY